MWVAVNVMVAVYGHNFRKNLFNCEQSMEMDTNLIMFWCGSAVYGLPYQGRAFHMDVSKECLMA